MDAGLMSDGVHLSHFRLCTDRGESFLIHVPHDPLPFMLRFNLSLENMVHVRALKERFLPRPGIFQEASRMAAQVAHFASSAGSSVSGASSRMSV